jgi:L-seryl-tRNA(Ser) seleniumtransferase
MAAKPPDASEVLRRIPSVEKILRSEAIGALLLEHPRWAVTAAIRQVLDELRTELRQDASAWGPSAAGAPALLADAQPATTALETAIAALLPRIARLARPSLRRVINATGVVLHTNLGRAPLSQRALAAVQDIGAGYSTLEYDPERRERASRHDHVADLVCALTGAEAAAVVNNNAGAVLLALTALAAGRGVVVSRGELVEIGGGFRVPDVIRLAGVQLHEVGTTNRTRIADYSEATDAGTALLLKVHRSNFALVGFTEDVSIAALARLARQGGLPVMVDLGSGALIDLAAIGLPGELTVTRALTEGADLCTFSGDKLVGGPQAGIIAGRKDLVDRIRRHPLMRALRPDKLTLAALRATLASYLEGTALADIPTLRMLAAPLSVLEQRKDQVMAALTERAIAAEARVVTSKVGGGALPTAELETWAITLPRAASPDALAAALAEGDPSVVARIQDDRVVLDLRTVLDAEVPALAPAIEQALRASRAPRSLDR